MDTKEARDMLESHHLANKTLSEVNETKLAGVVDAMAAFGAPPVPSTPAMLADRLVRERGLSAAMAFVDLVKSALVDHSFKRLRELEAEALELKKTLQLPLGFESVAMTSRASDRSAEEQLVLEFVLRGKPDHLVGESGSRRWTAAELAVESKVGARISAVLARLAKQGLTASRGRGPKASWGPGPKSEGYVPPPSDEVAPAAVPTEPVQLQELVDAGNRVLGAPIANAAPVVVPPPAPSAPVPAVPARAAAKKAHPLPQPSSPQEDW